MQDAREIVVRWGETLVASTHGAWAVRETSPPGTAGSGRDGGRRRSSLAQITDLLWGSKDKSNAAHHNNTSVSSTSQGACFFFVFVSS
jgi:hypothetical protein